MLFWLVTTAINLIVGALVMSSAGHRRPARRAARSGGRSALNALAYLLWAVLGVGIGVLIRSQIGATVTGILLYLVGTSALPSLICILADQYVATGSTTCRCWCPSLASQLMVAGAETARATRRAGSGAVVLIGYAVVAGAIGTLIIRRRDIS